MATDYQQTDSAAVIADNAGCSGASLTAGTSQSCLATAGGAAGTTEDTMTISGGETSVAAYMVEIDPAGDVPLGNHTAKINPTNTNANVHLVAIYVCWWNGSTYSTLGSNTGLSLQMNRVRSQVISCSASPTYSAGNRLYYVYLFTNAGLGSQNVGITPNQLMTTPQIPQQNATAGYVSASSSAYDASWTSQIEAQAQFYDNSGARFAWQPISAPQPVTATAEYIAGGSQAYDPSATPGQVTATAGFVASASATYDASASPGAATAVAEHRASAIVLYAPGGLPQEIGATVEYIVAASVVYDASAAALSGLTCDFVGSALVVYDASALPGLVNALPGVAGGATVYDPSAYLTWDGVGDSSRTVSVASRSRTASVESQIAASVASRSRTASAEAESRTAFVSERSDSA